MNEKDLTISENILALARRRRKSGKNNKRSLMLKMIMPALSQENGEKLADAIKERNSAKFKQVWDGIKQQISEQLESTKATAGTSNTFLEENFAELDTLMADAV